MDNDTATGEESAFDVCRCGHERGEHDGTTNAECGAYIVYGEETAEDQPCECDEFDEQ